MAPLVLLHWNAEQGERRLAALPSAAHAVRVLAAPTATGIRALRARFAAAALDETWAGLCFSRRARGGRPRRQEAR